MESSEKESAEVYLKDSSGREMYVNIRSGDPQTVFAKTFVGPRYARLADTEEYYPVVNGKSVVLNDSEYARSRKLKREIYPLNHETGDEEIYSNYAKSEDGSEVYPRRENGSEYMLVGRYALDSERDEKYPIEVVTDEEGRKTYRPQYPVDPETGDQVYFLRKWGNDEYVFGTDDRRNQMYAKTNSGDEYYPSVGVFAFDSDLSDFKWALTSEGEPVFPIDSFGNETYVWSVYGTKDVIVLPDGKTLPRYAKSKNGSFEIYPREYTDYGWKEVTLNDRYATNHGSVEYPRDEFNNDYALEGVYEPGALYPIGYPLTWDGFVIVSASDANEPLHFPEVMPKVQRSSLKKQLFRSWKGFSDFLSDEKVDKQADGGHPYKTRDYVEMKSHRGSSRRTWWKTIAWAIAALVTVLLLWNLR